MILLLGGAGHVAAAFARALDAGEISYRSVSRKTCDYTRRDALIELIRDSKPSFLINAAGYTGRPNVDACEIHKADCLAGNASLPGVIREACEHCDLAWGHVSSGCIYTGTRPGGGGFREEDTPNFTFRTNHCSFYSGCKALGEECLEGAQKTFLWRLRIPFNEIDGPRNYLSKLMRYDRLLEATNSISQLDEFARASLQCWSQRVPFGTYNVTNTGAVTTRQIVALIRKHLTPEREFKFFRSEDEFMQKAAKAPRSNCVMDNSKLRSAGIEISEVHDAIELALRSWKSEACRV